jgi:hypothetical protein
MEEEEDDEKKRRRRGKGYIPQGDVDIVDV